MIEIITKHNIDDILENPEQYVDCSEDLVLYKVHPNNVMVMIGQDEETGKYYFVIEDDESSIDIPVDNKEQLKEVFKSIKVRETK